MRLELVPDTVSEDTLQALVEIAERVQRGEYIGFIIGLVRPRRKYSVHCVGEACNNPAFARGICLAIDDKLQALVYGQEGPDTKF